MSIQTKFRKVVLTETPSAANDATTKSYVDTLSDGRREDTTTTTDGVATTIATIATTSGATTMVVSNVTAVRTDVAGATAAFQLRAAYRNTGAALEQLGADDLATFNNVTGTNYTMSSSSSGTNVIVQVQGDTGHTVDWKAVTNIYES